MTFKLRKIKIKRKSMRKQKRNYLKKYQKGGGVVATYEPHIKTAETAYANSIMNEFAFNFLTVYTQSRRGVSWYEPGVAKYLAGCGKFIGPNKLLPLNNDDTSYSGPGGFYYMSQIVHDSCIITKTGFKRQGGEDGSYQTLITYHGYKKNQPSLIRDGPGASPYLVNFDDPFGDKFLVYPMKWAPDLPHNGQTRYSFIPTEKSNIYNVPGIGDVIMNDPGNGEPWYGEKVTVIFDYNFKPPKINKSTMKDEDIDEDTGIHKGAFAAVGTELHNMEDE